MHYWNKDNFEGLLALASALEDIPQLQPLANYCRLRERGLRKQALEELRSFISTAKAWNCENAREFVVYILELHARVPNAYTFMTEQLWNELVFPVLDEWHLTSPEAIVPMRWLGLLRRDIDLLERTLQIIPNDVPVRRALIKYELFDVDYATHHLDETLFLGEINTAIAQLERARKWLDSANSPENLNDLRDKLDLLYQMVLDWISYLDSPQGTFPEWCHAKGRKYRWSSKVYYQS